MSRVKPSRVPEEGHVGADHVRPLSRKQRKELEGYISWSTELFRVFLFLLVLGVVAVLAKLVHTVLVAIVPSASHDAWWVTPVLLSGIALFVVGGRGTGGNRFRASVRRDLAEGVLTVRRITVAEAIEVEQGEDEGPSYFLRTSDGRTMLLWGQYLERYKRRGFPWTEFEILETPHSRTSFGMTRVGDKLEPSLRRRALSWKEVKRYGDINADYQFIDDDFDVLKERFAALDSGAET